MRIEGFAGVKVMVVNAGGGGSTVRAAGELVTPEDDAVTCAAPAAMPVAIPPWTVAMTLLEEAHVKVSPVMGLLYWSFPVAVKVCLLPTCMDADAGATLIFVNTEGARTTVRLIAAVCVKLPEVPMIVTAVTPTVAEPFAVRVKVVEVNDAVTPLGRPEAARLTLPVKPPVGVTVIVLEILLPWVTLKVLGADRVKFGGGVTVSRVDMLRPLAAAVMLVVPAVSPAANPDVFTVATVGRLLVKVKEALIACPCWFSSVALNCCVAPA